MKTATKPGRGEEEKRYTNCTTAGPVFAYVKNGRIIRTEPLHFKEEEVKPWTINVNGRVYTPPLKYPLLYWGNIAKQWVYSNRVSYPLKRVDWEPKGERHPENRGKSGYYTKEIESITTEKDVNLGEIELYKRM